MKVLILDTRPLRRGAQVFAHDLSRSLQKKGVLVKKIYLYDAIESESLTLSPDDEILGGNDTHIFEKIPTIHPWLLIKLIRRINSWNPDIILLNGSRTLKYGAAAKGFLNKRIKLIYRVIDSAVFWNNKKYTQLYYRKLIMPRIDAAAGVSAASLRDMRALHHFNKPSTVIHRAIETSNFQHVGDRLHCRRDLQVNPQSKVLLFLGNLTQQKRPNRFVQVLQGVKNVYPDIQGWIVGDGILKKNIENLVSLNGLEKNITFWGYQKNVGPFLAASDVLLLTSDTEGLPGVVLEAGYFCVPTVSTDVGGIKECIENEKTGFIAATNDIDTFIKHTLLLLKDEALRLQMGKAAQTKVNEAFTMKIVAEKYYNFFVSLLAPVYE